MQIFHSDLPVPASCFIYCSNGMIICPQKYGALPTVADTHTDTFPPIWVHPAPYAAALQIHSLARILVILNRPSSGDVHDYRAAQILLTLSVNTICGIARTIDESDSAANLVSIHCLSGGRCFTSPVANPMS